jgi:alpha-mannosidase
MITATPHNALVSGFKRSEDGSGYIVRLRETAGRTTQAQLRLPALGDCQRAYRANGVEETQAELQFHDQRVSLELQPWEVATLKLE